MIVACVKPKEESVKKEKKIAVKMWTGRRFLDSYPKIVAVKFVSVKSLRKALRLLWGDLFGCPHRFGNGDTTIIVPKAAVPHLKQCRISFRTKTIVQR